MLSSSLLAQSSSPSTSKIIIGRTWTVAVEMGCEKRRRSAWAMSRAAEKSFGPNPEPTSATDRPAADLESCLKEISGCIWSQPRHPGRQKSSGSKALIVVVFQCSTRWRETLRPPFCLVESAHSPTPSTKQHYGTVLSNLQNMFGNLACGTSATFPTPTIEHAALSVHHNQGVPPTGKFSQLASTYLAWRPAKPLQRTWN